MSHYPGLGSGEGQFLFPIYTARAWQSVNPTPTASDSCSLVRFRGVIERGDTVGMVGRAWQQAGT